MDLMGMMGKMKETQQKIEETKTKLDNILIDEISVDGLLKVTISANNTIKNIHLEDALLIDKEMLEDYLVTTLNKAISKATKINQTELDAVTKIDLPLFPGMEDMFK